MIFAEPVPERGSAVSMLKELGAPPNIPILSVELEGQDAAAVLPTKGECATKTNAATIIAAKRIEANRPLTLYIMPPHLNFYLILFG
jgi:hypothetical protein